MPHVSAVIDQIRGPIISVNVGISAQRASALKSAGQSVPPPITCHLLLDTGASMTNICQSVISKLGITPTGNVGVNTPSTGGTPHQCSTYDISIVIPGAGPPKVISALPIIESDFSAQGIHGLIGRDILAASRFIYSGNDGFIMLSIL